MRFSRRLLLPLCGALAFTLVAGDAPKAVAKSPSKAKAAKSAPLPDPIKVTAVEGITEYRLANGLRVLLYPDASKPTATTNITYMVGSRHEHYGETGMAHLLEHMLFKGTKDRPETWKILNELGGDANGTTNFDRTNYYVSFPASEENLKKALDLEADRMLNCTFTAETLWGKDGKSGEMTVVRNEFESGENNPFRTTLLRVLSVAFDWHNYGKPAIGARSDIEHVNVQHLRDFYQKYYQPDNAVLVVAGKFDEPKTLAYINATFGRLPRPTRSLEPTYTVEPTQDGERQVTVRRVGGTPLLVAGYHSAPAAHADRTATDMAASILADVPSGRLYKALVETKLAAQVFQISFTTFEPGLQMFGVVLPKDGDMEKAKEALVRELEGLKDKPLTQAELDRAKVQAQKGIDQALSDTKNMAISLSEAMAAGDWREWFLDRDRTQTATLEQVQTAAVAYFKPSNRTLGQFIPTEKPDRTTVPGVPDIDAEVKGYTGKQTIAQGEAFDASPANVDQRTLRFTAPNGLKGALLSKKTKGGMASIQLTLRFGQETALRDKAATPGLTGGMLMRGTLKHSRQEIADAFDKLKAEVSITGGATSANATLTVPRENLAATLRLVAEVLREPAFPVAELDTLVKQQTTGLESQRQEPQAKAMEFMGQTFDPYPAGHPSAYRSYETRIGELKAAKVEDLKAFHAAFYGADHATFAASGDFDAQEVQGLVTELFGSWKATSPYERIPARLKEVAGQSKVLETPDKQMAFFLASERWAMKDTDADYPAFLMANQVLGGGALKNRIADRLRQKEGFSYGAGSFVNVSSQDPVSAWQAYAIYAPQNVAKLEAAFHEEIQKALKEGFTQDELEFARKTWLQGEEAQRQEDKEIAGWLNSSLYLGRSVLFQAELETKVKALKLDEVNAALRKYLDPAKLVVVKAGDFAKDAKK
ncbi:MAG: insulinase family protein [Geothrix sp.]|uniref:M16 family metallopeptidase n=1 Tax=Geothrix sp. TaxID=1962974 RepID=UPI0017AF9BD8|nr:pitrilysin family protein [Geothrix sp.]NWJ41740.1 insulinase family protein [Geothrix sp.]WIL20281.1 MAG: insulinase family protein [Geothrix sp.]